MEEDEIMQPTPIAVLNPDDGSVPIFLYKDTDIGRNNTNAVCIPKSLRISRRHCIIKKSDDHKFTITDLSTTGTYVNGQLLGKDVSKQLHHRDRISLANEVSYTFGIDLSLMKKSIEMEINSSFQEKMLDLDNTHSQDMMKLNDEMIEMESKKCGLKEEMNAKLKAQEDLIEQEHQRLRQLMATTEEQKDEMERKLREMEEKSKVEKQKLMEEVENKITDLTKKVEDVQKLKEETELKYEKERAELVARCKAEVEELKGKLVESQIKQELLQGETKQVEEKLSETKQVLIESEMEQHRLFEEKQSMEKKLEETLDNLTKISSDKNELLKNIQILLREKEEEGNRMKKEMEEFLEEQLQCSICAEVFIEPTILTCGHTFCKRCIDEWLAKKKVCPMCRTKITNCMRIYTLDPIVNKNVALMTSEARERREKIIKERKGSTPVPAKKRKHHHRVNASTSTSTAPQHIATPAVPIRPPETATAPDWVLSSEPPYILRAGGPNMSDPFAWRQLEFRRENRNVATPTILLDGNWMSPQQATVSVAAIDLTNIPHTPEPPPQRVFNEAIASASFNDTVDLTNL